MTGKGVGSRLIRKEDDRYLRGRGQFVADIRLPGMKEVAFARSPVAHARIRAIRVPEEHRGAVFTAEDLAGRREYANFTISDSSPIPRRARA